MHFLQDNPFATGMIVTTVLAATLAYMRNVPAKLMTYFWALFSITVEIKSNDMAFSWIAEWLDHHVYSKSARRLRLTTVFKKDDEFTDNVEEFYYDIGHPKRKKTNPKLLFTPSNGEHWFWHKGRFLWLSRSSETVQAKGIQGYPVDKESFSITVLGRKQSAIRDLINEAMLLCMPANEPETVVITSADGRWSQAIRRKPRTRESVILKDGLLEYLIDDANQFLKSKDWYDELSIPYRRGYLLHGTPGSGKTSAVLAVAGELALDVYLLNVAGRMMDDGVLNSLLGSVPVGSIVLLEDVDAVFSGRKSSEDNTTGVTFSGLLNALDGVASCDGRILFMTTNHKEKLDAALIRPGRADVHVEFDYALPSQAAKLFKRFFPSASPLHVDRFASELVPNAISMAAIQDHLLANRDDIMAAITNWPSTMHRITTDTTN